MPIKSLILKATSGPLAGQEIKVESGKTVRIGRTPKADIASSDPYMSGIHFAVECHAEACRVLDLNSRHGTFLNGEKTVGAVLREGDEIYAGQTTFVAHLEETPAESQQLPTIELDKESLRADVNIPSEIKTPPAPIETPPPVVNLPVAPQPLNEARQATEAAGPATDKLPESVQQPAQPTPRPEIPPPTPPQTEVQPPPSAAATEERAAAMPESAVERVLRASNASTPEGRLIAILRSQREPLFAILDAAHEPTVPQLLRASGEEYQSLYQGEAFAEVAPYLVSIQPTSRFLERLAHEGWGHGWVVFLTCSLPLGSIREYFRRSLMIRMPDGREFFSRFYDPRFFRNFLRGCTQAEADRYFGPISSYLIEADNPEILLQFTRSSTGVEMKERLLLIAGT